MLLWVMSKLCFTCLGNWVKSQHLLHGFMNFDSNRTGFVEPAEDSRPFTWNKFVPQLHGAL